MVFDDKMKGNFSEILALISQLQGVPDKWQVMPAADMYRGQRRAALEWDEMSCGMEWASQPK